MNNLTITDTKNNTCYTRVNKTIARKHFYNGDKVILCPHKAIPFTPWQLYVDIRHAPEDEITSRYDVDFDKAVDSFNYYNTCHELGYYPAYYIEA